jgi:hypothetical protein
MAADRLTATPLVGGDRRGRALALGVLIATLMGCGGSSPSPDGAGGSSGGSAGGSTGAMTGSAGTTASGGATGSAGAAGTSAKGGTTGSAGATGAAGATGSGGTGAQPIGAACVNSGMCSQADGPAVCCLQIQTCVLESQCPSGGQFVSCATQPCARSGWVCCNAGGMQFCTKQSACPP